MKKALSVSVLISLSLFCSCQKQQTDAERNAEVERQVQQRLEAERQAEQKDELAKREGELTAREKEIAEKENAPAKEDVAETERTTREERTTRSEQGRAPASYDIFYTKLESQGDWLETSDYGYVWQPREAGRSRGWRPYTNGHWVYTDAGWTWISEESFGWATYHYGRWTRLRNVGWVWVPGDEWAPAWVSWRKSNDYVGWAPLPPEARFDRRTGIHNWSDNYYDIGPDQYCFVPTNEFGAERVEGTILPAQRNVTIINQTTNVTNITYNNTTIVNQGPDYDELRSRVQRPIPRLRLERDVNVNAGPAVVRGEAVVIAAPKIERAVAVERPRRVKETLKQVAVDRGWEEVGDRQAAEKVRAKIKSETTPPPNAPAKTFVRQTATDTAPGSTSDSPPAASSPTPAASPAPKSMETPQPSATLPRNVRPMTTPTASPSGTPSATPTVSPKSGATSTPTPGIGERIRARRSPTAVLTPVPGSSPENQAERPKVGSKLKSQAQRFNPRRVSPNPEETSPTPSPTAAGSPASPAPSGPPDVSPRSGPESGKEQRKGMNRPGERRPAPDAAPRATPTPTPTPAER